MVFLDANAYTANATGHITACLQSSRPVTETTVAIITYTTTSGIQRNQTVVMIVGQKKVFFVIDVGVGEVSRIVDLRVDVQEGCNAGVTIGANVTIGSKSSCTEQST